MDNADQLPRSFPSMRLRFAGEVDLPLPPQNYLFAHFDRDGAYCLGIFQNVQAGSLLGGITFRDILVQVLPVLCLCRMCICIGCYVCTSTVPSAQQKDVHLSSAGGSACHATSRHVMHLHHNDIQYFRQCYPVLQGSALPMHKPSCIAISVQGMVSCRAATKVSLVICKPRECMSTSSAAAVTIRCCLKASPQLGDWGAV